MTMTRTFPVWRNAGRVELLVPIGHARRGAPSRIVFRPHFSEIFEVPLSYDGFRTGPSDYENPSDEIYCPCGETLRWLNGDAGDLLRRIDDHCKATPGHPMPVRSEAF